MSHVTYSEYLQLDKILTAQQQQSDPPEHDEMLFIIIHQTYELWFKQMLHEIDHLITMLVQNHHSKANAAITRMLTILKTIVSQIDILETMTPLSFSSFRDRLQTASGFQSLQFREVEVMLGSRSQNILSHQPEGTPGHAILQKRINSPTLYDALLTNLSMNDISIPIEILNRDHSEPLDANPDVQTGLLDVYRNHAPLAQLCERFVDFDEGIQEWRYRHVKMVERTIGTRSGSGGSAGADYLRSTLFQPAFPDLWAIRSEL